MCCEFLVDLEESGCYCRSGRSRCIDELCVEANSKCTFTVHTYMWRHLSSLPPSFCLSVRLPSFPPSLPPSTILAEGFLWTHAHRCRLTCIRSANCW